jgi:putative transposase
VLFDTSADYEAFKEILTAGLDRFDVALFAYCLMRNHWHLLLSPRIDGALSRFMHWVTTTHARRWQSFRHLDGQGAVYQGRFKAVPVCDDRHFLCVCRYIERNPLRAGLVQCAGEWHWSSLSQRARQEGAPRISAWPVAAPFFWSAFVDATPTEAELQTIRTAIRTGQPIGPEGWREEVLTRMGVVRRRRGRPPNVARRVSSKNDSRLLIDSNT